jgi:hypothetical protein
MPRRPAHIVQSDIARIIRAAKQEGATEIEVQISVSGTASVIIRLDSKNKIILEEEIIL